MLLLTDATVSYPPRSLEDRIEAKSIIKLRIKPMVEVICGLRLPDGDVVEGIAPIWSYPDRDGVRAFLITVSNSRSGARLIVFNDSGETFGFGRTSEGFLLEGLTSRSSLRLLG